MSFYLGIDGGGSKTACLIGNETSVLGSGTSAGSNVVRLGEAQAREALHHAIRQACSAAGTRPEQMEAACVGVAGAGNPDINSTVQHILSAIVPGKIHVVGDMEIALEAAFGRAPGVVVIAGTGSIAYARDAKGNTARAGGWGFAVSDEGSGHWIGRAALTRALRAHDQGVASVLLPNLIAAWHLSSTDAMVLAANSTPAPNFSTLFPVVVSAADAGDAVSREVLSQAGKELAALAKIVIHRQFGETAPVPVAMSGGVFVHSALVRQVFYNTLHSECPMIAIKSEVIEPVFGALQLAREHAR